MKMLSNRKNRTFWLWLIAVVITLASVAYQRLTGPSYPVSVRHQFADGSLIKCKLPTSSESNADAPVRVVVPVSVASGQLDWRRLNSRDPWALVPMQRTGDTLIALLPKQPPAGKLEYAISLRVNNGEEVHLTPKPVVLRFKGHVPMVVLVPHILFMFVSMLMAAITGLQAFARSDGTRALALVTALGLFVGGLVLGPMVQNYAFGAYWTGWPIGHDLTDNKTALAMLMWFIALWRSRGDSKARGWMIAAAIVHFAVYLIPHSVLGSEIDYTAQ